MITTNDPKPPKEMNTINNELAVNLKLSQELLTALQEESLALRAMDTQELFRISRQKDTLLAKIQYLDAMLRKSLAEPTDSVEASGLTPEESHSIAQYKHKISMLRQEIQARNMINKRFTEDTLGYLSDAIGLFTRPVQDENTYHIAGRSQTRGKDLPSFISCEA